MDDKAFAAIPRHSFVAALGAVDLDDFLAMQQPDGGGACRMTGVTPRFALHCRGGLVRGAVRSVAALARRPVWLVALAPKGHVSCSTWNS